MNLKLVANVGSYVQFCVAPAAKLHIAYVVPRFYLCVLKWGTTSNKEVYDINTLDRLTEYWNNGTISYRYPRSTRRIGVKTINKHCIKNIITLQHFCPF